ncbi:DUF262 domain-containing protein [Mesorhizobium sp. M0179]|uniref:DUF262 domain-containing protein n=1 Tax=unclassified Mesorhizobium TaxID=325217 RepID=UPI0003CF0957|nr:MULTISPECIES: DUF262 domain-containing protein [unclassified Mesorhizobium]ESX14258.1 hypothetical protein X768_01725 [Mesorhizobium sp. LSJC265A00]ESY08579.1 hypothetical protein X753_07575 [Mesorhizobium sp. LNJC399B00]WJI69566.1 DUF262 domain-containing protein [Mesorhizobium sp. C399B]
MRSYLTSYNSLFTRIVPDSPAVESIEIPLIQRDYAQGRAGTAVERIRTSFLDVLYRAVTCGESVCLDFVYGDVENGTLRPLDGQQRLTTLFLLHWYLAFRAERLNQEQGWKNFSYVTRASARLFCERLVESEPPATVEVLSAWIADQFWYLHTWRHDPTIQSMLVMLDAMHERFRDEDCLAAWERLIDGEAPAISFHLLPIEQVGLSDDLYIKMNSRGKPLTPFENFKALFEKVLETSCPDRVEEFASKIDGAWSDLLWRYRSRDFSIDDGFLRYFHFIAEVSEWQEGRFTKGDSASLAEDVYGRRNSKAAANLEFLFQALDTWVGVEIQSIFAGLFSITPAPTDSSSPSKVVLYAPQGSTDIDLFSACCQTYGQARGRNRVFGWPQTMLLYAVLLHRIHKTHDFARRLRVLRNLVEASSNELRLERMPELLADVRCIVIDGALEGVSAFNQAQVADEKLKQELLSKSPNLERNLFHLEDHQLLRGCLAAFELDEAVFDRRAGAFHKLFASTECMPPLTGALLAIGDYSRQINTRLFQFGSGSNLAPWRELLTAASRLNLSATRAVLGNLLDVVASTEVDVGSNLSKIQQDWLDDAAGANGLGWRWYFVKYPAMRESRSGIYVGSNGLLGYSVCMLNKTQLNSWYRDPYLYAIYRESGVENSIEDPWFTGHETESRWMRLSKSGTELRCVAEGLVLRPPPLTSHVEAFSQICAQHGVGADRVLLVPQVESEGVNLDACNRVELGAALLRGLVGAGL